jgi:alpha-amylase
VLASLPPPDRIGQLTRMADEIEDLAGRRPRGAWLAERVWEPDLPVALADAGYEYTILDDAHLRAAAIPDERHWSVYSTDDRGRRILFLATMKALRVIIPFRPVADVIDYLRDHATEAGDRVAVMGDDGEKFGAWPETWELCWGEEAWVERFFSALEENGDWLTTFRPMDAINAGGPVRHVYIPTGSYAEMGKWSLPADERSEFIRLVNAATLTGRPEVRWMQGGFWRNFQVNYREIGDLHKQMLRVSRKVSALSDGGGGGDAGAATRARIIDHLYLGQSNDCYWHGLFGGIYLSHLRLATAAHLIAAEDAAERRDPDSTVGISVSVEDVDLDGRDEILALAAGQVLTIKPDDGGGIGAWDVRAVRHALTSVMRRRPESYHDALRAHESGDAAGAEELALSIDGSVRVTEPGLSRRLWYDDYERRSGLVRFLPTDTSLDQLEQGEANERGDFLSGDFRVIAANVDAIVLERDGSVQLSDGISLPVSVRKRIEVGTDRREPTLVLSVDITNRGSQPIDGLVGVEWSLNMLGGGGNPEAWLRAEGKSRRFDTSGQVDSSRTVAMGNEGVCVELTQRVTPEASLWWYSIETISASEQGFERNHQGSCVLWTWPLRLAPGDSLTVEVDSRISTAADRAEEEGL